MLRTPLLPLLLLTQRLTELLLAGDAARRISEEENEELMRSLAKRPCCRPWHTAGQRHHNSSLDDTAQRIKVVEARDHLVTGKTRLYSRLHRHPDAAVPKISSLSETFFIA